MRYLARCNAKKFFIFLTSLSIAIFILIFSARVGGQEDPQKPDAAAETGYVGEETCATCHAEISEKFPKSAHGGAAYSQLTSKGCEHCHGPGQEHVDSNGDVTLIRNFKRMKASEASDFCLQCHEKDAQKHWKGSVHDQRELGCVSCHSVHSFKSDRAQLKTTRADEQCATCHQNIKAQIMKTSHHPIREGLMQCSSCHNPHGTLTPKMITANSVNEQCYTCHAEKRGPFLWEHPPVKENCLNCHNPHGSNHPKLMVQKRPFMCQTCHLDTRHPGTLYDGTVGSLTSNRDFSRSCSNCHLTIHGSNHPSGWTFTR